MKFLKITLAISVIVISIFGQIIDGMNLKSIMLLLLGAVLLTMVQKKLKRKKVDWIPIGYSCFI